MDITWYGHSCFRLRDRNVTIVTDPYGPGIGYTLPKLRADIVTVSHTHADHSFVSGVKGNPRVLSVPGEYEIAGVFITGIPTYHDKKKGAERGKNTAFLLEFDGLSVCHLGDLGHVPTQSQVEALSQIQVDVLLVPVGGESTINAAQAAEVVSLLEPRIVVPMHYKTQALTVKLASVNKFLKAMGLSKLPEQDGLKITSSNLPEETQVVLLSYKQA
ncbi:MAG: MBL fold metallo-hydrolase [Chloroflexota bacterium]|nr:MBL fold metallo-hydrolase [Chloroflexota bacterium]